MPNDPLMHLAFTSPIEPQLADFLKRKFEFAFDRQVTDTIDFLHPRGAV